ncbi:SRPBCC family protein [Streptomyces sp. BV286]|uniref:SRPBCC family protein n=1 Tax=unclassified Streptomyces TaxID=2593676 RepID=UPI001C2EA296|nr:SRPBCC family protein [Streptomyces sp. BV286]MBV1941778.1 SRPBCC family protein [Streptomyces sp. BV286]
MPSYDVSAQSSAAPSTIQRLLVDVPTWTRWQPFESVEAISPSSEGQGPAGTGTAWALWKGRIRTDIEIVDVVPDGGMSYAALQLMGMREYRAEISLTPLPDEGTDIRWRATFTPKHSILNRLWEWYLNRSMRDVVGALARYAER